MTLEWDTPQPEPVQAAWFRTFGREILESYDRLHEDATADFQRAGHGGESAWVAILKNWLPPSYEVVTRKYIIPEMGNDVFETDIVVLNPSYPPALRVREQILPGGVAAAFSVKLTLNAAGIRDGIDRAVRLRRALRPRIGTPRHEMLAPFPVGVLAHSHNWIRPGSDPAGNISNNLKRCDDELVRHPRESLDYLCVSDLATWATVRQPYVPPSPFVTRQAVTGQQRNEGAAFTTTQRVDPALGFNAISTLITRLLARLSFYDSTLRPLADNLVATGSLAGVVDEARRIWALDEVFTSITKNALLSRSPEEPNSEWAGIIF